MGTIKAIVQTMLFVIIVAVIIVTSYFLSIIVGVSLIVSIIYIIIREYHRETKEDKDSRKWESFFLNVHFKNLVYIYKVASPLQNRWREVNKRCSNT